MRRDEAISRLKENRLRLAELGVRHAYLFGSVARDAAADSSDIDIMVDLDEGPDRKPLFSAFDVGGIQYEMTRIFGRQVDLVVRGDALRRGWRLRAVAEGQLVDVFGEKDTDDRCLVAARDNVALIREWASGLGLQDPMPSNAHSSRSTPPFGKFLLKRLRSMASRPT